MKPTILIVDDEKHTRNGLRDAFDNSFDTYVAADIASALSVLKNESVDLMVTDLRLGGGEDGMKLIDEALKMPHPPICMMMTAYGGVDMAVEAMKRGAYDFVTKPVNIDQLELRIRRALKSRDIEKENVELKQQVDTKFGLGSLIGDSLPMTDVFDTIKQVAPSRATVLISGESGTGKELAAHAIHNLSSRDKAKFVAVHCAALSSQLLESELFGHERGAFTGAVEKRVGRFEQAHGGTLFLDEIGEIDANTQVKILRALDPGVFERVGGNQTLQADVRLITATNKDLEKLVAEGKFRDDLFWRLNVVQIHMPSLRERREDIALLASHFLKRSTEENKKPKRELSQEAMQSLITYNWPGNVRELRAAIEHAVVLATGSKITLRDLPPAVRETGAHAGTRGALPQPGNQLNLHETEYRLIMRALEECKNNRTAAAKRLGISRRTLHRKLNEMKIEEKSK